MIIVNVDGGAGRVLCAIPAIEELSKHDEVTVLTAFPGLFKHNPNNIKTQDSLPDKDGVPGFKKIWPQLKTASAYYHPEPYNDLEFIKGNRHLIASFKKEFGLEPTITKPNLYLTEEDKSWAIEYFNDLKQRHGYKDIIIFQPFGQGGIGEVDNTYRSLTGRHAEMIINLIREKYPDIGIIYAGTVSSNNVKIHTGKYTLRQLTSLVWLSKAIVAVDSLVPHIGYCFDKKGIVFWGSTNCDTVGYPTNINIYKNDTRPFEYWQPRFPVSNESNTGAMYFNDEEINKAIDQLGSLL